MGIYQPNRHCKDGQDSRSCGVREEREYDVTQLAAAASAELYVIHDSQVTARCTYRA